MTVLGPSRPLHGEILVEVEMRGRAEVVRWTAGRVEGHADVVARLHHAPSCAPDHPDAQDPVAFLRDVRSAFGDRIRISVDPGS